MDTFCLLIGLDLFYNGGVAPMTAEIPIAATSEMGFIKLFFSNLITQLPDY